MASWPETSGDSYPTPESGAEGVLVMAIVYVVILLPYLVATSTWVLLQLCLSWRINNIMALNMTP